MNILSSHQLKSLIGSLNTEFENLFENKEKLEIDCTKFKEIFETQSNHLQTINGELELLKREVLQRKVEKNVISNTIPTPKPQKKQPIITNTLVEENNELEWDVKPLTSNIPHPVEISLLGEIIDLSVICSTSFSPDGSFLAIGSNKIIRVYNVDKDEFILNLMIDEPNDSQNHIRSIAWTPDSRKIISGSEDHRIRVFDITTSTLITSFIAGPGEVFQVQCAYKEKFFASATGDGVFSIWNLSNFSQICSFKRDTIEPVVATTLSISDTDKILAVGYSDGFVVLFDTEHKRVVFERQCHPKGVYAIKYLPTSRRITTSSLDFSIRIWDVSELDNRYDMRLVKTLEGHTNYVLSLAIDPKGKWLLSGSKDLTAKLTSLESGLMTYIIKAHTNSVITVSFNQNGSMFCTGSGDKSVKIWSITPEDSSEIA